VKDGKERVRATCMEGEKRSNIKAACGDVACKSAGSSPRRAPRMGSGRHSNAYKL
jgi:hypothetical protein